MESNIKKVTFLVRINDATKLEVPLGSLELIVQCALHAGSDVCILSKDNPF